MIIYFEIATPRSFDFAKQNGGARNDELMEKENFAGVFVG